MIYNTKKKANKAAHTKSLYKKKPAGFKPRRQPSRTRRAKIRREGVHSTLQFGGKLTMVLVAVFCVAQLFYYGKNLSAGDHGFFSSAWTAVIGAGMNGGEGNGRIMGGNGTAGPGGSGEDGNGNSGGGIGTSQSDTDSGDAEGTGTDRTDTDKNRTDADQANSNSTDANSTDINNTDTNNTDTNNVDTNNADTNNTGINNTGSNSTDHNSVNPNSTDPNSTNPNSADPKNGNSKAKAELTGPGRNQNLPPFTGAVSGAAPGTAVSDGAEKVTAPDLKTIEPLGGSGNEYGPAVAAGPSAAAPSAESVDPSGKLSSIPGPVDASKPMIAFTFDDGPFTKVDQRILDVLDAYGGRATFFIVGSRVNDYKDTLKRIHNSGSEIGNHTYNHKNLENLAPEEVISQVEMTNDAVEAVTGFRPKLVRVPYGAFKGQVSGLVSYPMIQWNIDTEDWSSKDKDAILSTLLSQAKDGSIILMHDLYPSTAEAFEAAVPQLVTQGYQLVTVSEMYAAKGVPLEAGQVYFNIRK